MTAVAELAVLLGLAIVDIADTAVAVAAAFAAFAVVDIVAAVVQTNAGKLDVVT